MIDGRIESNTCSLLLWFACVCVRSRFVLLQCAIPSVLEDATLRVVESVTDRVS
jgi:hypothetical protein